MPVKCLDEEQVQRHHAAHEAGHVVVARALHLPLQYATIVPRMEVEGFQSGGHIALAPARPWRTAAFIEQPDGSSVINTQCTPPWERPAYFKKQIMVCLAGQCAECLLLNKFLTKGDVWDQELIVGYANQLRVSVKAWTKLRERLENETQVLLILNREIVQRVADALCKHQTLSGPQLETLLTWPEDPRKLVRVR